MDENKLCEDCKCNGTDGDRMFLTPYYEYCNLYVCRECAIKLGIVEEEKEEPNKWIGGCGY